MNFSAWLHLTFWRILSSAWFMDDFIISTCVLFIAGFSDGGLLIPWITLWIYTRKTLKQVHRCTHAQRTIYLMSLFYIKHVCRFHFHSYFIYFVFTLLLQLLLLYFFSFVLVFNVFYASSKVLSIFAGPFGLFHKWIFFWTLILILSGTGLVILRPSGIFLVILGLHFSLLWCLEHKYV